MARRGRSARNEPECAWDWAAHYLPHYFTDEPALFHREFFADLADPELRLIARVAPRGHAKSTCAALAYPLYCVCEQKRRNIVIITHEAGLATQFVRDIREELEHNERILVRYGTLCSLDTKASEPPTGDAAERSESPASAERRATSPHAPSKRRRGDVSRHAESPASERRRRLKSRESFFTTTTGVAVQAKGSGASFRGARVGPNRPDLIVCDDVETDELAASAEGRRKLEHWMRRVVMPALAPGGQLVVLGSLIHHDSLLANLRDRKRFPRWNYRVYRALEAESDGRGGFHLRALWPARWSVARLEEERERVGTLAFEQEYQCSPQDDSLRVFRPEWLRRCDAELLAERSDLVHVVAVDPATGEQGGDFFALWVGALDPSSGRIYSRELRLERIGIVQQVERIVAAWKRWSPLRVGIETTAYQVALKQILEDHSRRHGLFMPIVPLKTLSNKRARIEGAAPFFENGTFLLPEDLSPEAEAQFLHFPKARHDDAPDVCAMGIELARSLRGGRVEVATLHRRLPRD